MSCEKRCQFGGFEVMLWRVFLVIWLFFFQAEDGIRCHCVTGVQTCALPIYHNYLWGGGISYLIFTQITESLCRSNCIQCCNRLMEISPTKYYTGHCVGTAIWRVCMVWEGFELRWHKNDRNTGPLHITFGSSTFHLQAIAKVCANYRYENIYSWYFIATGGSKTKKFSADL